MKLFYVYNIGGGFYLIYENYETFFIYGELVSYFRDNKTVCRVLSDYFIYKTGMSCKLLLEVVKSE